MAWTGNILFEFSPGAVATDSFNQKDFNFKWTMSLKM